MKGKIISCLLLVFMFSGLGLFGQSYHSSKESVGLLLKETSTNDVSANTKAEFSAATSAELVSNTERRIKSSMIKAMIPQLKEGVPTQQVLNDQIQRFGQKYQANPSRLAAVNKVGDYLTQLLTIE